VAQYIHLLSQTGSGMPTDVWVPATATATPSTSHQWVAGIHGQVGHGIGLSWETFYKTMHHLIDYKDVYAGDRSRWEQRITQGKGTSYGTEILIEKQQGRLQGWASYTLSWSTRQFDALNGGAPFPFRYDRRHNLATTATWSIRPGKMLSASWMYTSGARVTLPQQAIAFPGNWMPADHVTSFITGNQAGWFGYDGGTKNNYQIRPFHKLDISFTKTKAKKTGQAQWSYGVYNLYARKNPFHVFPTYKFW
jgi:hypothetical protein